MTIPSAIPVLKSVSTWIGDHPVGQHSEQSEHSEHSEPSEHFEHLEHSEHSEHSEYSEHTEHYEHSEHSEHSGPTLDRRKNPAKVFELYGTLNV